MIPNHQIALFGEVLFDIFPTGEKILGGAPFNVAWNLQALGDAPLFISRVGQDLYGADILQAMRTWGMSTTGVQCDPDHATGQVQVELTDNEPRYQIVSDRAYDFIHEGQLPVLGNGGLLYHGTLGLRHTVSRNALDQLRKAVNMSIFLDVNLRDPWWNQHEVEAWLLTARWVKLNKDELCALGFRASSLPDALEKLQNRFQMEQVILTCGEEGAIVRERTGDIHHLAAPPVEDFIDTVGAGDAFSAVYLHGLLAGWGIPETLDAAQRFAGKVISLRGATSTEASFYRHFLESCS
jgi:fructokinase